LPISVIISMIDISAGFQTQKILSRAHSDQSNDTRFVMRYLLYKPAGRSLGRSIT
jgi:hypothetical protein